MRVGCAILQWRCLKWEEHYSRYESWHENRVLSSDVEEFAGVFAFASKAMKMLWGNERWGNERRANETNEEDFVLLLLVSLS